MMQIIFYGKLVIKIYVLMDVLVVYTIITFNCKNRRLYADFRTKSHKVRVWRERGMGGIGGKIATHGNVCGCYSPKQAKR
jgi:hypothetical protein